MSITASHSITIPSSFVFNEDDNGDIRFPCGRRVSLFVNDEYYIPYREIVDLVSVMIEAEAEYLR